MFDQPFRFLQASDLQLDAPLGGLGDLPERLQRLVIDAPYRAAERLFEAAVAEQVAFVTLGGDVLGHPDPTARALAFLQEQFTQLGEQGIDIYWAAAQDVARWPESVPLPANVVPFQAVGVQQPPPTARSTDAVTVLGCSVEQGTLACAAEFSREPAGSYMVAVLSGGLNRAGLSDAPVDYWALAGHGTRATFSEGSPVVHDAGPLQGRTPAQVGPHGGTLVEVGSGRQTRLRFVPCDSVRWHQERVTLSLEQSRESWQARFADRVKNLRAMVPEQPILVRWLVDLVGDDPGREPIRERLDQLRQWLRRQFGDGDEPCWTVAIEFERPAILLSEWLQEDTLLGDYLRAVDQTQETDRELVTRLLPADARLRELLGEQLGLANPETRTAVLVEAAEVGALMLRGEEGVR